MNKQINNSIPKCLIVHPNAVKLLESLAGYIQATSQKDNIVGTYKSIPIVTSNNLQEDEIYCLFRGRRLDEELSYVKWEEENE